MSGMYSKSAIDKAGYQLIKSDNPYGEHDALEKVNYWRSIHKFPLKWLLSEISSQTAELDNILVAGRIKKFDTIVDKLIRPNNPNDLKTMFDIAGCRIVVENLNLLYKVSDCLMKLSECDKIKSLQRDYIKKPKNTGYRGRHLIFQRKNEGLDYGNGLWVELQIRTRLQHAWATAVEIYDMAVLGSRLKFGEDSNDAGKFFKLVSQLIESEENENCKNDKSVRDGICAELKKINSSKNIIKVLSEACNASSLIEPKSVLSFESYCLIDFDVDEQLLNIQALPEKSAVDIYLKKEESSIGNHNLVLVRASSLDQLQQAYPNYFGDISVFLNFVNSSIHD